MRTEYLLGGAVAALSNAARQGNRDELVLEPSMEVESEGSCSDVCFRVMEDVYLVVVLNNEESATQSDRIGGPDLIFVDPGHFHANYDYVFAQDV